MIGQEGINTIACLLLVTNGVRSPNSSSSIERLIAMEYIVGCCIVARPSWDDFVLWNCGEMVLRCGNKSSVEHKHYSVVFTKGFCLHTKELGLHIHSIFKPKLSFLVSMKFQFPLKHENLNTKRIFLFPLRGQDDYLLLTNKEHGFGKAAGFFIPPTFALPSLHHTNIATSIGISIRAGRSMIAMKSPGERINIGSSCHANVRSFLSS